MEWDGKLNRKQLIPQSGIGTKKNGNGTESGMGKKIRPLSGMDTKWN